MRLRFILTSLGLLPLLVLAQEGNQHGLNAADDRAVSAGTQLVLHVGGQAPAGPLADRFGLSNTVGMGVRRTTHSGWRFGAHYRFQTGADVRETGLLQNLIDPNGHIVDNEGRIALVTAQQRGTLLFLTAGRKWAAGGQHPETGFIAEVGAGFWEHKIHFQNRGNRVTQLDEPHLAGYDRLTGGGMLLPRIGFEYHSPNGQARLEFGLEACLGRLQPNRIWNADTGTRDTGPRSDRTVGVFAGWILRLKARSSSLDYYY